jgi:hypothetical protein
VRLTWCAWALAALSGCERAAEVASTRTVAWPGDAAPCDPAAAEICNGRDDDCDGEVDEDAVCADPCRVVKLGSPRCGIRADGALLCWGRERAGLTFQPAAPFRIDIPEKVVQVSRPCARTESGRVYCWSDHFRPRAADVFGNTVAAIAYGTGDVCALRSGPLAGTVWCWRGGDEPVVALRELGDQVVDLAGGEDGCARRGDGSIWCRSFVTSGPWRAVPALGTDNVQIAVGANACTLKADGRVVCVNRNTTDDPLPPPSNRLGELGTGSLDQPPAGPVVAQALGSDVQQLFLWDDITCVATRGGRAMCVGAGLVDPLIPPTGAGHPAVVQPVTPAGLDRDVVEVSSSCARKRDGSVWCWGDYPGDGTAFSADPLRVDFCPERAQ